MGRSRNVRNEWERGNVSRSQSSASPLTGGGTLGTFGLWSRGTERNNMNTMEESQAKNKAILEALVRMAFRNSEEGKIVENNP